MSIKRPWSEMLCHYNKDTEGKKCVFFSKFSVYRGNSRYIPELDEYKFIETEIEDMGDKTASMDFDFFVEIFPFVPKFEEGRRFYFRGAFLHNDMGRDK